VHRTCTKTSSTLEMQDCQDKIKLSSIVNYSGYSIQSRHGSAKNKGTCADLNFHTIVV